MEKVLWPVKIHGMGSVLPNKQLLSDEIDTRLGRRKGTTEKHVGIASRPVRSGDETQITLAVDAARQAIAEAGVDMNEIDLILFASAVGYQPIPATAPLIMRELGITAGKAAAFDINATCLSFLSAFDIASSLLKTGRYQRILIVSSELASCGLPWHDDPNTAALFGDGAAAALISSTKDETSGIVAAHMETWHDGYEDCQIGSGGTRFDPKDENGGFFEHIWFRMNGKSLFRHTMDEFDGFLDRLLDKAGWRRSEVDLVVPHQASPHALVHLIKRCGLKNAHIVNIMKNHGNQISASIPIALHAARKEGRFQKGKKVLMLGTSAGLSFGGLALYA